MLDKTLYTFYASNIVLQQQYREHNLKRCSESCFIVVEQNNELLMKNYQSHLTCSKPFPEVNGILV
jgi:hypothetical protein